MEWTKNIFLPVGEIGLFLVSLIESSVFPVPPDVLLIPLALLNPQLSLYYALITTLGSTLGGLIGYYLGLKGGRAIARKLFSEKILIKGEVYFKEYGVWAVFISAFSPIPYKVFTILSGITRLNLVGFLIASIIGRGLRFFGEAILIIYMGEKVLEFLDRNFELITLSVSLLIFLFLIFRRIRNRKSNR